MYQARQLPLPLDMPVDLNLTFEIPVVLEQAMIEYIAYKAYCGMNGQEHKAKGADHLTMYDNICLEVIERDLVGSSMSLTHTKLEDRGFV
jgi:hypothetical protein